MVLPNVGPRTLTLSALGNPFPKDCGQSDVLSAEIPVVSEAEGGHKPASRVIHI